MSAKTFPPIKQMILGLVGCPIVHPDDEPVDLDVLIIAASIELGASRAAVRRAVRDLVRAGWIRRNGVYLLPTDTTPQCKFIGRAFTLEIDQ